MTSKVLDKKTTLSKSKEQSPKYSVILHNDEVNDVVHVMKCLQMIVGLSENKAHSIMMTAHTVGKALVITCELEHAEHYKEQLINKGLTATIEQV